MVAVAALCGVALTGCTPGVGNCAQAVTPAPLISIDVKQWIRAHPDTNVRACVDGDCTTGYSVVTVAGEDPTTPFHDGDTVEITVEPVRGETAVESFITIVHLVDDTCGQWGASLRLNSDGRISPTTATPPH